MSTVGRTMIQRTRSGCGHVLWCESKGDARQRLKEDMSCSSLHRGHSGRRPVCSLRKRPMKQFHASGNVSSIQSSWCSVSTSSRQISGSWYFSVLVHVSEIPATQAGSLEGYGVREGRNVNEGGDEEEVDEDTKTENMPSKASGQGMKQILRESQYVRIVSRSSDEHQDDSGLLPLGALKKTTFGDFVSMQRAHTRCADVPAAAGNYKSDSS